MSKKKKKRKKASMEKKEPKKPFILTGLIGGTAIYHLEIPYRMLQEPLCKLPNIR